MVKSPIGLNLCSWNANGLLRRRVELRIFIEKHSPDIFLIQETHLRSSHTFTIANYTCYRNDRITNANGRRRNSYSYQKSLKHYSLPTPPMQAIEATNIILTPLDHDPVSIVSVYIPPSSDDNLFTIDLEYFSKRVVIVSSSAISMLLIALELQCKLKQRQASFLILPIS
ncbi:putative RNA-directed DNA polymerase from transposon X-element [Trichonephila clavipes]|nr:putative RNA-directed DNA polymerase from transposon X-element [Trichonephila clavipes]